MSDDQAVSTDNVQIVLRDAEGNIKQAETCHNLIVTAGVTAIVSRLASSPGSAVPTHMAVGTSSTAASAGQTTLVSETDRNALTSNNASGAVLTMVGDWAAGDATAALTEAGVFSASSNGTMFARAVFSVVNKAAGDTLSITWTFTLTAS